MKTGVYKLSCNDCECFYIGQTGRGFYKRFVEHTPKHNVKDLTTQSYIKSNYARHLIQENHNYTSFDTNLKPIHVCGKGAYLNAREEFEIYKAHNDKYYRKFILNDHLHFKSNPLYDTALKFICN